jgi:polyhydroxyalkanoate synthase subunit PhaC
MRRGPRPLTAHIGLATASWPHAFPPAPDAAAEVTEAMQQMLLGIKKYQDHPYIPEALALETFWQRGTVRVCGIPGYDYKEGAPAIVLVPSLINRANILDLMPGRSLLRWLGEQGINPYLLDWGDIVQDPEQGDMDTLIMERLVPALEFAREKQGGPIHALGYCMGGTILMGAAVHVQDSLKSIILLAAPWDFHSGTQALLNRVKFWAPSAAPTIAEKGVLAVDWIQMLFASLDPALTVNKFAKFLNMDPNSDATKLFIAVEDWLNDGIDIPADIAQHCIADWFLKNTTGQGAWEVGGKVVDPAAITIPALIIASSKDRLVEFECAASLHKRIKGAKLVDPYCGHIGMIAGRESVEKIWQPLAAWVQKNT